MKTDTRRQALEARQRWVVVMAAATLLLLAAVFGISKTHSAGEVGPGAFAYLVVLPQLAVLALVGIRQAQAFGLGLSIGVGALMCVLAGRLSVLGLLLAPWNFGGLTVPSWYWDQWWAGALIAPIQLALALAAWTALRRLPSQGPFRWRRVALEPRSSMRWVAW